MKQSVVTGAFLGVMAIAVCAAAQQPPAPPLMQEPQTILLCAESPQLLTNWLRVSGFVP